LNQKYLILRSTESPQMSSTILTEQFCYHINILGSRPPQLLSLILSLLVPFWYFPVMPHLHHVARTLCLAELLTWFSLFSKLKITKISKKGWRLLKRSECHGKRILLGCVLLVDSVYPFTKFQWSVRQIDRGNSIYTVDIICWWHNRPPNLHDLNISRTCTFFTFRGIRWYPLKLQEVEIWWYLKQKNVSPKIQHAIKAITSRLCLMRTGNSTVSR